MLQYIPTLVTIAGLVALVIRQVIPFNARIPTQWQWVLPALLAVCGAVSARFVGLESDLQFWQQAIETIGILVAAGVRGYSPEEPKP